MSDFFVPSWNHAIQSIKTGMMIIGSDGTIENMNEPLVNMAEQHGISPEHFRQGISLFDLDPSIFAPSPAYKVFFEETYLPSLHNVLQGIEPEFMAEYNYILRSRTYWLLCEIHPIRPHRDADIHGAVISFFDITRYKKKVLRLEQALSSNCSLPGHVPICAVCKHVHNEQIWQPVESYLENRMPIEFTHDICPSCIRRLYPGYSSVLERKFPGEGQA